MSFINRFPKCTETVYSSKDFDYISDIFFESKTLGVDIEPIDTCAWMCKQTLEKRKLIKGPIIILLSMSLNFEECQKILLSFQ